MDRIDRKVLVIGGIITIVIVFVVILLVAGGRGTEGADNGGNTPETTLTQTPGGKTQAQTLGEWFASNPSYQRITYQEHDVYQAVGISGYCSHLSMGESLETLVEFYGLKGDRMKDFREANITHFAYREILDEKAGYRYDQDYYIPSKGVILAIPGPCQQVFQLDLSQPAPQPTYAPTAIPATSPTAVLVVITATPTVPICQQYSHTVQTGENLFRIALRYGTTYQEIAAQNGIEDHPEKIYVGQVFTFLVCR